MIVLNPGDSIRAYAAVASKVSYIISGRIGERLNNPQPRLLTAGLLSDSAASIHGPAPIHTRVDSIILVNTHTAAVAINIYIRHDGTDYDVIPKSFSLPMSYMLSWDGVSMTVFGPSW